MAKLQLGQQYHCDLGTAQICILEHRRLRHGSGIHGEAGPFAAGFGMAYDSTWAGCDSLSMTRSSSGMPQQ